MIGKLLTIETNIHYIERIIIIKKWQIRESTGDIVFMITALDTDPILHFILSIHLGITFESNCDTLTILLDQRMQRHIDFGLILA